MTRPHVACVCLDAGIHAAVTVEGEARDQLLAAFRDAHSGPGHLPEVPPRDWYGKHDAFLRHLAELRKAPMRSEP